MKLNAPKGTTWWIALILGVLGVVSKYIAIPVLSGISFWLEVVALLLLVLATKIKGL